MSSSASGPEASPRWVQ